MSRQAQQMQPRWRGKQPIPQTVVQVRGRGARKLTRQLAANTAAAQAAAAQVPALPVHRNRHRLVPVTWGFVVTGTGLGLWLTHRPAGVGFAAGGIAGVLIVLATRHLDAWARKATALAAALTALWLPLLAAFGPKPALPVWAACWAVATGAWVAHHRIRPQDEPPGPTRDEEIWERLAAKRKWQGKLVDPVDLPGGGRQWGIELDGIETHIGEVMAHPRAIAAAYGKAVTEAFAEPDPAGNEARGLLTKLKRNTLEDPREWDGAGIDPEAGLAVVGRFPDGKPAHELYFVRRSGTRHTIVAGSDGSGKTGLLNLGLSLSATSGIIAPVILDPQEGQALPDWREFVPYAAGAEECMAYIYGLHAAMMDRSKYLGSLRWQTESGDWRTGMSFFDPYLTGLPIVEATIDESSALLTDPALGPKAGPLLADMAKLARKTGFRFRLAIHVPSLAEFGHAGQPLRSILTGGNVFCGRTGDRVSGGMLLAACDPCELPKFFGNGKPTVGLGYANGYDNRPATPMRWDWVRDPYAVAAAAKIRGLDDRAAEAMDTAMRLFGAQLTAPASSPASSLVVVDDSPAPGGQCAADAVLAVLTGPMERGEIIRLAKAKSTEWGRDKPFSLKAISDALAKLKKEGRVTQPGDKKPYSPVRPSLTMVRDTSAATGKTPATTAAGGAS